MCIVAGCYLLEGGRQVSVNSARVQHDAGHIGLAPITFHCHCLGQLVEGSLAGPVAVPSTQSVVTDAAHPCTHVGYDRRLLPGTIPVIKHKTLGLLTQSVCVCVWPQG